MVLFLFRKYALKSITIAKLHSTFKGSFSTKSLLPILPYQKKLISNTFWSLLLRKILNHSSAQFNALSFFILTLKGLPSLLLSYV